MIKLGELQTLFAVKRTDSGMYFDATPEETRDKVLLPKNQASPELQLGESMDLFIYKDSEDRIIATTAVPKLTLGGIALLPVKSVTPIGAFLDWGLTKDLLLPFKEQTKPVEEGETVLASLYIDKSSRLCATMKLYHHLSTSSPYQKDDTVTGWVYEISENFGAFVAVDNQFSGLIPKKELFTILTPGQTIEARVQSVKEDGKLDLSLREKSYIQMDKDAESVYQKLNSAGGFLPYHDKSDADDIKELFALSKNSFKRAVGRLLKEGRITLTDEGIQIPAE